MVKWVIVFLKTQFSQFVESRSYDQYQFENKVGTVIKWVTENI